MEKKKEKKKKSAKKGKKKREREVTMLLLDKEKIIDILNKDLVLLQLTVFLF